MLGPYLGLLTLKCFTVFFINTGKFFLHCYSTQRTRMRRFIWSTFATVALLIAEACVV